MSNRETIETYAKKLIELIVENAEVEVHEEDEMYHVAIKTEDEAPTIIGRHGETIRALQKILEVVLYKKIGESVHILVNVNDYREKQRERLEYIAEEHAKRVHETGMSSTMRGFSSFERKILHEYITTKYPELTSYSVGEGKDRRLVVDVKSEQSEIEETTEE